MEIYYDVVNVGGWNGTQLADAIYGILSHYDNRFIHTEGTPYININNIYELAFGYDGYFTIDTFQVLLSSWVEYNVTTIITDIMVYMVFIRRDNSSPVMAICWICQDNKNYIGVSRRSNLSYGVMETMSFRSIETPTNTYYKIKKHADFTLAGSAILFISASIISDDAGNFQVLDGLRSCSNVTFNTMVSINHRNYYAIGTNTLVLDA